MVLELVAVGLRQWASRAASHCYTALPNTNQINGESRPLMSPHQHRQADRISKALRNTTRKEWVGIVEFSCRGRVASFPAPGFKISGQTQLKTDQMERNWNQEENDPDVNPCEVGSMARIGLKHKSTCEKKISLRGELDFLPMLSKSRLRTEQCWDERVGEEPYDAILCRHLETRD